MENKTMKSFWDGFEKRADQEKSAILGAVGAHVLQNTAMKPLLRSGFLSRLTQKNFMRGLLGRPIGTMTALGHGVMGGVMPELGLLPSHMHEMGTGIRNKLRENGINKLTSGQLAEIQSMLQEGPARISNPRTLHEKIVADHLKSDKRFSAYFSNPDAANSMYHSKDHPILSNIAKNLVKPEAGVAEHILPQHVPHNHQKVNLAGGILGSLAVAPLDLATGAMNMGKMVAGNPAAREALAKRSLTKKFLDWTDRTFVKKPIESARQAGAEGKVLSKPYRIFRDYVVNPTVGSAEHTVNQATALGKSYDRAGGNMVSNMIKNPAVQPSPKPAGFLQRQWDRFKYRNSPTPATNIQTVSP